MKCLSWVPVSATVIPVFILSLTIYSKMAYYVTVSWTSLSHNKLHSNSKLK